MSHTPSPRRRTIFPAIVETHSRSPRAGRVRRKLLADVEKGKKRHA